MTTVKLKGGASAVGANEADPIFYLDPGGSTGCPGVVFDGTPKTGDVPLLVYDEPWGAITVAAVFEIPSAGDWSFMMPFSTATSMMWNFGGNSTHWWITNGDGTDTYTAAIPENWWGTPHYMVLSADFSGDVNMGYFAIDGVEHIDGEVWPGASPSVVVFGNTGEVDVIGHWWGISSVYSTPLELSAINTSLATWMTTIGDPNGPGGDN